MPVIKVSAKEMLGGRAMVMSANPAIVKGLKKLQEARIQADAAAAAINPSKQRDGQD